MDHVYIVKSAARDMRMLSSQVPTETGGLLVGTLACPAIVAAGSPGPHSVKSISYFTTDAEHDLKYLNQMREQYGMKMKYLGHWHKHPKGLTAPSGGDLSQARELLKKLELLGETQPTLLCVILQDLNENHETIFPYVLKAGDSHFRKLQWTLVADDADEIRVAITLEPTQLSATDTSHPWGNPSFRFQDTPAGLARLEVERAAIADLGYSITTRSRKNDRRLFFELKRDDQSLLCIFPSEFPLGAPTLLRTTDGSTIHLPFIGCGWNSDMRVSDLLTLLEAHKYQPEHRQQVSQVIVESSNPSEKKQSQNQLQGSTRAISSGRQETIRKTIAWILIIFLFLLKLRSLNRRR